MENAGKGIAACPSCHKQYKVPLKLEGKRAACKKCGTNFLLRFQSDTGKPTTSPDSAPQPPPNEGIEERKKPESAGIEATPDAETTLLRLRVSDDRMTASISLAGSPPVPITVEAVKDVLASKGVCFGIAADDEIAHLIGAFSVNSPPLIVAHGELAVEGQPSEIKYYFDTDPMKIGTLKQDGVMDFRDRGEIPQVKKGELLAMKSPGSPGKPGMDVLGTPIPCSKPMDIKLQCGKGVKKSEDGVKAHALLDGEPVLSADGKISVFSKLQIPGDVDFRTGHVKFDGDIHVRGTIQNDFRVEGGRLSAMEILRTDIDITGDVAVAGGIIGATIHGDGNLKARFIHEARLHVLGDVVVEKEVIDSDITTSGTLLMERGKLFNSRISAKMGIMANQIGSEGSKPCSLNVGVDEGVLEKIRTLKHQRTAKKTRQKKLEKAIQKLQTFSVGMHKEISELAQVQDRGSLEQKALKEKVEEMTEPGDSGEVSQIRKRIEEVDAKVRRADARLGKRMDQQDDIQRKIDELGVRIKEIESDIALLEEDMERIGEWSRSEGGSPTVKVVKTIYSNTTIKGPHCAFRLRGNRESCLITEKRVRNPESQELTWEMAVEPLK